MKEYSLKASSFSGLSDDREEGEEEESDVIDLRFTFGNDKTSSFSGLSDDWEEGKRLGAFRDHHECDVWSCL